MVCSAIKRFKTDNLDDYVTFRCLLEEGHLPWHVDRCWTDEDVRWEVIWIGDERVKCPKCNKLVSDLMYLQSGEKNKEICEECAEEYIGKDNGWY